MHPVKRLLLCAVAFGSGLFHAHAQNVEGQVIASQFGEWKVPSVNTGFTFPLATCMVSGGGKNLFAFTAGVPVKVVDDDPSMIEVATPVAAFKSGNCSVSLPTTHAHTSFYLTSGTGGLQEAISSAKVRGGGPNTIVLNAEWYELIAPRDAATVIGSVAGSASFGLVDVTTLPYTWYRWNGSQYVVVPVGGSGISGLTATHLPVATSAATVGNSAATDDGATLKYPGTGGVQSPQYTFGDTTSGDYGILSLGDSIGDYPYLQLFSSTSGGTTVDSTGVYSQKFQTAGPIVGGSLLISGVATLGTVQNGTPGSPIVMNQNGGNALALQVNGGLDVAGALDLSNGYGTSGDVVTSAGAGSPTYWAAPGGSGGPPSGAASNALAGTYPGPSLAVGALPNGMTATTQATGDNSTKVATTASVYNSMPMLLAQYFGAYGDAYQPPNGCNTVASSTTVVCNDTPFVSTDVGKQIWISGKGAGGAAFNATITAVIDNQTVTVSAAPSATGNNVRGIFGHDDTAAVQACFQYSASNAVPCALKTRPNPGLGLVGFLIGSGSLQFVENNYLEGSSGENIIGSSQVNGTNLFCEFNGDCINLAAGAIQGLNFTNISIQEDATQPNSRGIHLNPQHGTFGPGPFTNANFNNVSVYNPALECLWLDGGGGPGYDYSLPNQYVTFNQFWCSGPPQSHPANMILMTGQAAQIVFINGQLGGDAWNGTSDPNYPNPMIKITEKTTGLGDTPVDVKFFGFTYEVGTQGLYIGPGASNIHFDNGYVENVSSPLIMAGSVQGATFIGNHLANSGNIGGVAQFGSGETASLRDNYVYGGVAIPAAFATCSGPDSIDFANNNSTVVTTTGCATPTATTTGSTLSVPYGVTESVTATGGAINTINAAGANPGKTLTLYAPSAITLESGGNIDFAGVPSPLVIPSGGSVTLTLLDSGVTWIITGYPVSGIYLKGTTHLATSAIASGACQAVSAGSVNSSAAVGATSASNILWTPSSSLQAVTGYKVSTSGALSIDAYPTAGYVNFNVCNPTAGGITPGALTLNWELHP
jgi:hypothetical protein